MQVEEFLENSAGLFPDKVALVCGSHRETYRGVDRHANQLAWALRESGVNRSDRVAIFLENTAEAVYAVFAALKAGGVFLVINPTTKAEKLAYILNNCRAKALITSAAKLGVVEASLGETPHLQTVMIAGNGPASGMPALASKHLVSLEDVFRSSPDISLPRQCIDIDLAALIYTSGSTGRPKGVMVTHLNVVSAATSITTYLENTDDDIILNVLPLSFDYGLYQMLMAFKVGGTLVLERSFAYPAAVLELLIRERITGLPLVPTISSILLQFDLTKYRFPYLRYISNTAAALPTEHILRLRQLFPHVSLYSMYGLTECKRVSYLPPSQIDIRPGSVGRGMPNEEVYLVDDNGRRLPAGSTGELVIRGSNVMKGYWELPEETDKMLKPGPLPGEKVLYSGDLFRTDDEGYLYFLGRKDDIIKTRGEKVSPKEVEDVLYSLNGVVDAAVVGVPDPVLGSAIKAILTVKPGVQLTAQEVLNHCASRLESFMIPKLVEFRESLPKTDSGKIRKRDLASEAGAHS